MGANLLRPINKGFTMSSNHLEQETAPLTQIAFNYLKKRDSNHTDVETEVLAKQIVETALKLVSQKGCFQRYESYALLQKKVEIIVEAFAQNFQPEKHSLNENLHSFNDYISNTYGSHNVA
jgi:hemerythrin superfamily protein